MEIEVVVGQVVFIEQQVESNIKGLTLEHRLAFTEAVSMNLHSRQLSSFLLVRHLATVGKTIALEVEDTLILGQEALPRAYILTIGQTLFVWDEAVNEGFWPKVDQNINLSQMVEVDVAKAAYDTLSITETIGLSVTRNLTIEQTFTPIEGAIGYLPDKYWSSFGIEVVES